MAAKKDKGKQRTASGRAGYLYLMQVLVLIAATGAVIWVFGGDVYVAVVLALCALGLFAVGIAPGLIPRLIRYMVLTPFLLGGLIPLWGLIDAALKWNGDLALRAGGTALLYAVAVLLLVKLPERMRGPFEKWLPEQAIPEEERAAWRQRLREQREAERRARREKESAAYAAQSGASDDEDDESDEEAPRKGLFGFGRRGKSASTSSAKSTSASTAYTSGKASAKPEKKGGFWRRGKQESSAKPAATSSTYSGGKASAKPEQKGGFWRRGKKKDSEEKSADSQTRTTGAQTTSRAYVSPFHGMDGEDDEYSGYDAGEDAYDTGYRTTVGPFYNAGEDDPDDDGTFDIKRENDDLMAKINAMRKKKL
jgi:hypothetical protein